MPIAISDNHAGTQLSLGHGAVRRMRPFAREIEQVTYALGMDVAPHGLADFRQGDLQFLQALLDAHGTPPGGAGGDAAEHKGDAGRRGVRAPHVRSPLRADAARDYGGLGAGPVAQLDRALPSEGRGREFESRRVRQLSP